MASLPERPKGRAPLFWIRVALAVVLTATGCGSGDDGSQSPQLQDASSDDDTGAQVESGGHSASPEAGADSTADVSAPNGDGGNGGDDDANGDSSRDSAIADAGSDTGTMVDASDTGTGTDGGRDSGLDGSVDASPTCSGTGWTLVWSDEFNAPDGTGIDPTKWVADIGGDGWGNQEREYYTSNLTNANESGGNLLITATTAGATAQTCWYGQCQYTSARLQTKGLFDQAYGRFEARIQIPRGQGLWPAFWMLGNDIDTVNWPGCGEIDVMENIGKEPGTVHGSMHGPGYSGGNALTASYALPEEASFADGFHVFAVEWETDVVRFYVDDVLYETETPTDIPTGTTWVFDHPFFVLLNVAIGGAFPGDPDGTTVFPQTMLVDYVRVCK